MCFKIFICMIGGVCTGSVQHRFFILNFYLADVILLEDTNSSWCQNMLASLLDNPSTHDVTFKTSDGGSVSAHRVIVAAGSPVFRVMLHGNMKESSQKEIELPNIDSNRLKKLFPFIYSGQIRTILMDYVELLQAADYFNIKELKTMCHDMITKNYTQSLIVLFVPKLRLLQ